MNENLKFEFTSQNELETECTKIELEITNPTNEMEKRLNKIDGEIAELDIKIDNLTNHSDNLDYTIAVASGLLTGIIDILIVGKWDFASAKAWSNKEINEQVINFAQQHPKYQGFIDRKHSVNEENRLINAIEFLEEEFKLPGDKEWKVIGSGISASSHHLDDFCHHPTLVGLVCCIIVQFSNNPQSIYFNSDGNPFNVPVTINDYGNFVGRNKIEKLFAGVINWFINVAKTMANRKGHLISDMAGSFDSAKRKTAGMGIPGEFLSTMKELSSLKCFGKTDFAQNLKKAYEYGIGNGKNQIDLGAFNVLFEGASSKFDMRTEMAISHELKRQLLPVIINEVLVRACYFIRRLIMELKSSKSILDINWKNIIPFNNRTIARMMTIATGTFTAVDMVDALIEGGGFTPNALLHLNFVGIGRFVIAAGNDSIMGIRRINKSKERLKLKAEALHLMEAKMYYGESVVWSAVKDANVSIDSLYDALNKISCKIANDTKAVHDSLDEIENIDVYDIEKKNAGLIDDLLDNL